MYMRILYVLMLLGQSLQWMLTTAGTVHKHTRPWLFSDDQQLSDIREQSGILLSTTQQSSLVDLSGVYIGTWTRLHHTPSTSAATSQADINTATGPLEAFGSPVATAAAQQSQSGRLTLHITPTPDVDDDEQDDANTATLQATLHLLHNPQGSTQAQHTTSIHLSGTTKHQTTANNAQKHSQALHTLQRRNVTPLRLLPHSSSSRWHGSLGQQRSVRLRHGGGTAHRVQSVLQQQQQQQEEEEGLMSEQQQWVLTQQQSVPGSSRHHMPVYAAAAAGLAQGDSVQTAALESGVSTAADSENDNDAEHVEQDCHFTLHLAVSSANSGTHHSSSSSSNMMGAVHGQMHRAVEFNLAAEQQQQQQRAMLQSIDNDRLYAEDTHEWQQQQQQEQQLEVLGLDQLQQLQQRQQQLAHEAAAAAAGVQYATAPAPELLHTPCALGMPVAAAAAAAAARPGDQNVALSSLHPVDDEQQQQQQQQQTYSGRSSSSLVVTALQQTPARSLLSRAFPGINSAADVEPDVAAAAASRSSVGAVINPSARIKAFPPLQQRQQRQQQLPSSQDHYHHDQQQQHGDASSSSGSSTVMQELSFLDTWMLPCSHPLMHKQLRCRLQQQQQQSWQQQQQQQSWQQQQQQQQRRVVLHGLLLSPNCNVSYALTAIQSPPSNAQTHALAYAVAAVTLCLLQVVMLRRQAQAVARSAAAAQKVSLMSVCACSQLDAFLSMAHLTAALLLPDVSVPLLVVAAAQFALFAAADMALTVHVWKAHNQQQQQRPQPPPLPMTLGQTSGQTLNLTGGSTAVQQIWQIQSRYLRSLLAITTSSSSSSSSTDSSSSRVGAVLSRLVDALIAAVVQLVSGRSLLLLYVRFYLVLLSATALSWVLASQIPVLLLAAYSFWIPQIIHNITTRAKQSLNPGYVLASTAAKLLLPLYIFTWPGNMLHDMLCNTSNNMLHSVLRRPYVGEALLGWVGVQVALLLLQHYIHPHVFVPKVLRPLRYNYHRAELPWQFKQLAVKAHAYCSMQQQHDWWTEEGRHDAVAATAAATAASCTLGQYSSTCFSSGNDRPCNCCCCCCRRQSTSLNSSSSSGIYDHTWQQPNLSSLTALQPLVGSPWQQQHLYPQQQQQQQCCLQSRPSTLHCCTCCHPHPHPSTSCSSSSSVWQHKYNYHCNTDAESLFGVPEYYHAATGQGVVECVICMCAVSLTPLQGRVVTPCGHFFHDDCLAQWMEVKAECPTCRWGPLPPL